jgi:hypothetical protein
MDLSLTPELTTPPNSPAADVCLTINADTR